MLERNYSDSAQNETSHNTKSTIEFFAITQLSPSEVDTKPKGSFTLNGALSNFIFPLRLISNSKSVGKTLF